MCLCMSTGAHMMSNIENEVDLMLRTWSVMFRIFFCHTENIFKLSVCFQKETLIIFDHPTDLISQLEVAEVLVQWTLGLLLCLEPRVLLG